MMMTAQGIPLDLISTVLNSPQTVALFSGADTHDPALKLVGQIAPFTQDSEYVRAIVRGALPAGYTGNTEREVPGMLAGAIEKGWTNPRSDRPRASSEGLQLLEADGTKVVIDEHGEAFLAIPRGGGLPLYHPVRSTAAKAHIRILYLRSKGKALAKEPLTEIMDTLEALALAEGQRVRLNLRFGLHAGRLYLDPGWETDELIEVTAEGWSIVRSTAVPFYRPPGFGQMPRPQKGGTLGVLKGLLGLSDQNHLLLTAFLVNTFRAGPFMMLKVEGEQGSGKSVVSTIVKRLVDPSTVEKLRLPRTEHDLMIQASQNHLPVFDNASVIRWDMSDAFCAMATGSGYSTRKYYTDNEARSFKVWRPVLLNGIGQFADRPDFMERTIEIPLSRVTGTQRKTERQLYREFEQMAPGLLGALLDAASCAMSRIEEIAPDLTIRMADAALWLQAAEPALGLSEGTLVKAIQEAQEEMLQERVANDPLVIALYDVLKKQGSAGFRGTVARLLEELQSKVADMRTIPNHPAHLSNVLKRLRPGLTAAGVHVEFHRRGRMGRTISIKVDPDFHQDDEPIRRSRKY